MADRVHIPNSPACGQWETLLADALDGMLRPEDEATFSGHMATCSACTALFEEARRGREWLEFLSPEPEIPEGLMDRILATTGPGQVAGYGLVAGDSAAMAIPPVWQQTGFMAKTRRFAEPRLMMTVAMAFFSIALTLNLTGIRLHELRLSDLRPSAMRSLLERQITVASTPIIRYYDHLRVVYEFQSRMRDLRRSSEAEGEGQQRRNDSEPAAPGESKQTPPRKDGGSRVDPPQQSGTPATRDSSDYVETNLTLKDRPTHSGGAVLSVLRFQGRKIANRNSGSTSAIRERSTRWIA